MFKIKTNKISKNDQIRMLQSNFEICNKRKQETDKENIRLQNEIVSLNNEIRDKKLALMSQEDYVITLEECGKSHKKEISNLKRRLTNLEKEMDNKIITELGFTKQEIDELMFGKEDKKSTTKKVK